MYFSKQNAAITDINRKRNVKIDKLMINAFWDWSEGWAIKNYIHQKNNLLKQR